LEARRRAISRGQSWRQRSIPFGQYHAECTLQHACRVASSQERLLPLLEVLERLARPLTSLPPCRIYYPDGATGLLLQLANAQAPVRDRASSGLQSTRSAIRIETDDTSEEAELVPTRVELGELELAVLLPRQAVNALVDTQPIEEMVAGFDITAGW